MSIRLRLNYAYIIFYKLFSDYEGNICYSNKYMRVQRTGRKTSLSIRNQHFDVF